MSSGFITETELAEKRRVRQEEWEKVRQPDQPSEAPEEEYDPRSLFERLQSQKQKRDLEYEEAHRLKNMIKGLDDDEVEFLDLVDRSKLEEERKKSLEEAREMAEFRNKVATLQEESIVERIQMEIKKPQINNHKVSSNKSSQSKLLAGAVVKKRSTETPNEGPSPAKKSKQSDENEESKEESTKPESNSSNEVNPVKTSKSDQQSQSNHKCSKHIKVGAMTCIGILPGLGHYRTESSDEVDSDDSSDVNDNDHPSKPIKFDLLKKMGNS